MIIKTKVPLKCINCGGLKYIGEPYHAFGHWFVDVTCLICAHSRDAEVNDLKSFLSKLEKHTVLKHKG
jgi:hypothetical protein